MTRRRTARLLALLVVLVAAALGGLKATAHDGSGPSRSAGTAQAFAHTALATGRTGTVEPDAGLPADVTRVAMPHNRGYLLLRPHGVSGQRPLVILLHGTNVAASTEMTFTGFGALARTDGFLLVAPQSVGPTWNSGNGCCGVPARDHLDDAAFVTAVIADVRSREAVDPRRIYLVGYSAGGKLSYDVACALGGTFAATASYGAGPQLACPAATPRPAFVGYGRDDTLEPIAGKPHNDRGEHQPAATTVAQLRTLDRCTDAVTVRQVGPAEVDRWASCTGTTAVEYVRWSDQTHTFPTTPHVPASATAATLMWQFFTEHPAAAASTPATGRTAAPVPVATQASAGTRT